MATVVGYAELSVSIKLEFGSRSILDGSNRFELGRPLPSSVCSVLCFQPAADGFGREQLAVYRDEAGRRSGRIMGNHYIRMGLLSINVPEVGGSSSWLNCIGVRCKNRRAYWTVHSPGRVVGEAFFQTDKIMPFFSITQADLIFQRCPQQAQFLQMRMELSHDGQLGSDNYLQLRPDR